MWFPDKSCAGLRGLGEADGGWRWCWGEQGGAGLLARMWGALLGCGEACGGEGGWMREESSQGERGRRLNQWPLRSVNTRRSWSLAKSWDCCCWRASATPNAEGGGNPNWGTGVMVSAGAVHSTTGLEVEWVGDAADVVAGVAVQPLGVWQRTVTSSGVFEGSMRGGLWEEVDSVCWASFSWSFFGGEAHTSSPTLSSSPTTTASFSSSRFTASTCSSSCSSSCFTWLCTSGCCSSSDSSSLTCRASKFCSLSRSFSSSSLPGGWHSTFHVLVIMAFVYI